MIVLYAGLVTWLVTLILVESELFRPLREKVAGEKQVLGKSRWEVEGHQSKIHAIRHYRTVVPGLTLKAAKEDAERLIGGGIEVGRPRLAYAVGCHLCAGTWVGLVLAGVLTALGNTGPFANVILDGLLYKAVAHLMLVVHKVGERLG